MYGRLNNKVEYSVRCFLFTSRTIISSMNSKWFIPPNDIVFARATGKRIRRRFKENSSSNSGNIGHHAVTVSLRRVAKHWRRMSPDNLFKFQSDQYRVTRRTSYSKRNTWHLFKDKRVEILTIPCRITDSNINRTMELSSGLQSCWKLGTFGDFQTEFTKVLASCRSRKALSTSQPSFVYPDIAINASEVKISTWLSTIPQKAFNWHLANSPPC